MKKLATGITIALLLLAILVEWLVTQKNGHHLIAEKFIGQCEAVTFPGADAYLSPSKAAIIFECNGFQGPIEALFVIDNNSIETLHIIKSNEGLDKEVMNNIKFLKSFEQNMQNLPLQINAISGATISSQIVIDEMNRHLKEWIKKYD